MLYSGTFEALDLTLELLMKHQGHTNPCERRTTISDTADEATVEATDTDTDTPVGRKRLATVVLSVLANLSMFPFLRAGTAASEHTRTNSKVPAYLFSTPPPLETP